MSRSRGGGSALGFRRIEERELHDGFMVRLTESTFEGPDGKAFQRDIVHTPDAVGIVPIDRGADGRWEVVLVRQYRGALDREVLEIPAGLCDVEGEAAAETAQRELQEEAGYRAREITPMATVHPAPGFTTHRTDVVLGVGLEPAERDLHGIEEEHMTVERVPLDEAVAMIHSGEITDGKSVAGLLLARAHLAD